MIETIEESDLTYQNTAVGVTVFELVWWLTFLVFGIGPVIAILLD